MSLALNLEVEVDIEDLDDGICGNIDVRIEDEAVDLGVDPVRHCDNGSPLVSPEETVPTPRRCGAAPALSGVQHLRYSQYSEVQHLLR